MKALKQADLEHATCDHPEHQGAHEEAEPLYLHSRCHETSPTWAVYERGLLLITCAECGRPVTVIEVAA